MKRPIFDKYDAVWIVGGHEKYPELKGVNGLYGRIMARYASVKYDTLYAVNIYGIRNKNSRDGYFYLSEPCLRSRFIRISNYGTFDTDIPSLYPNTYTPNRYLIANFKPDYKIPDVKNVYFNEPYTIVIWADKTKTIVKAQDGDVYSPETGLALCMAKKALGNDNKWYNVFKKWLPKECKNGRKETD